MFLARTENGHRGPLQVRLFQMDPESEDGRRIDETRGRRRQRLSAADRRFSLLVGGGFLAAAATAPFLLSSERSPQPLVIVLLILCYALAARVEFEVGPGVAVPTELFLVPMLFLLPLGVVPACVAGAYLLSDLPLYLRRRAHPERAAVLLASSWYVFGPVAVLAIAGEPAPRASNWPVYVAALGAQFAVDFATSAGRAWFAFRLRPGSQLAEMASVWIVDASLAPVGFFAALETVDTPYAFLGLLPLVGLIAVFARERRVRFDHALELNGAYRGTALLLGDVVEADDEYTGAHSRDVVSLVTGVAERLGLDTRSMRSAEFVALLHDVGKLRVPKNIINKPGRLTPEERTLIERHTIDGEQMLSAVGGILAEVGHIVRSCHEHWDGSGYPDGLAGEAIPLVARIVSACDAYSAMTTDRPYRRARSTADAIGELRRCSGTQFDPRVVEALIELLEGEAGLVVLEPVTGSVSPPEPEDIAAIR